MFNRKPVVLLAAAVLLALPVAVMGQATKGGDTATTTVPVGSGKGPVTGEQLIQRYLTLAGSEANAKSLVNGLRNGTEVTLTGTVAAPAPPPPPIFGGFAPPPPPPPPGSTGPTTTTIEVNFVPPTGNMGWGNVDIALAFTEAQLTELELGKPTPRQLQAALMGGEVEYGSTTPKMKKTLPGILQLRASNMGWAQIAALLGYKLQ